MNDLEIIKKCQKWDFSDFGILYDWYVDKIYNFIYMKTYDKEVSEDLTSDTFFKVLNKIHLIDTSWEYTFNSWIYKIAYNNIIDLGLAQLTEHLICINWQYESKKTI